MFDRERNEWEPALETAIVDGEALEADDPAGNEDQLRGPAAWSLRADGRRRSEDAGEEEFEEDDELEEEDDELEEDFEDDEFEEDEDFDEDEDDGDPDEEDAGDEDV